ncbi:AI-2E family transporter [Jeotgalibacillus salarius]|uniref:AI-2E family transporter n=1 Tax=Jeotgalibacillus salarius TaxID=546023 RepID=A0A4Y8LK49_9BACL|nr:AI-2E family transporter [Jeotgalibacillus salarius]
MEGKELSELAKSKWFRFGFGLITILIIIYLLSLVEYIFTPIVIIVTTLFAPIAIAGVLYYLLRPVVNFAAKYLPRGISILIIYLAGIGLIVGLVFLIGPPLSRQFNSLVDNIPSIFNELNAMTMNLIQSDWFKSIQEQQDFSLQDITDRIASTLQGSLDSIGSNLMSIIGVITNIAIVLVTIPFVLFYMLKDGQKLPEQFLRFTPEEFRPEGRKVLQDMDVALSSYIQGQLIVSFCVGVLLYIGYLIIGLEYTIVLALVAMLTNVIPFVGPFIGTIPAVVVGFIESPLTALFVIIVVIVAQQIESNLISPQVMGKKLQVHPLTIIFLLLVAGSFGGLLGLIMAVPTYAVGKAIVVNAYRFITIRKRYDDQRMKKSKMV